mmetsp:Transcript_3805/g.8847  ORF Transcript_3805/g.8847 Transcript_3805/m.8847 type:complete len:91 (+) Transcript_3805:119-391(+)
MLLLAAADIAFIRGSYLLSRIREKDHAVLDKFYKPNALIGARAAAAIALSSGPSTISIVDHAHARLVRFCGWNSHSSRSDGADIALKRGP